MSRKSRQRGPTTRAEVDPKRAGGIVLRFVVGWLSLLALLTAADPVTRWAAARTRDQAVAILSVIVPAQPTNDAGFAWLGLRFRVDSDCSPLAILSVLWAAVFAIPSRWTWRFVGLAVGSTWLWCLNVARISALALILRWQPARFEFAHLMLWQGVLLLALVGFAAVWARRS